MIKLPITIPALINMIIILMLDDFYDNIAESLTDFENHQISSEYEKNFILKKYVLNFVSLVGPIFYLFFLHEVS